MSCAQEIFKAMGGTKGYFYHIDTWFNKSIFFSIKDFNTKNKIDVKKILNIEGVINVRYAMLDLSIKFQNKAIRDQVFRELMDTREISDIERKYQISRGKIK